MNTYLHIHMHTHTHVYTGIKHTPTHDKGFTSVSYKYVLLPLVNKETALDYGRAEYS